MEELFSKVLDDDEKIVKVFKPKKIKLFLSNIILHGLWLLFFTVMSVLAILFPEEGVPASDPITVLIPIGIYIAIIALICVLSAIHYKNTYYAYSNKRIIVRSGIFGVDYKSLDLVSISSTNVYVSLLDKLLHKDTGSLSFGSASSPVNGQAGSLYRFNHIEKPYETCKEIKSYIAEQKNN